MAVVASCCGIAFIEVNTGEEEKENLLDWGWRFALHQDIEMFSTFHVKP